MIKGFWLDLTWLPAFGSSAFSAEGSSIFPPPLPLSFSFPLPPSLSPPSSIFFSTSSIPFSCFFLYISYLIFLLLLLLCMFIDQLPRYQVVCNAGACAPPRLPYDNFYLKHGVHFVCTRGLSQPLEGLRKVTSWWRGVPALVLPRLSSLHRTLCRVILGLWHVEYTLITESPVECFTTSVAEKQLISTRKRYEASSATSSVLHICIACRSARIMLGGMGIHLASSASFISSSSSQNWKGGIKLQAAVYDILPGRKVPESGARSVGRDISLGTSPDRKARHETRLRFSGVKTGFTPRVNFQCRHSDGVPTGPVYNLIVCIKVCAREKSQALVPMPLTNIWTRENTVQIDKGWVALFLHLL